MGLTSTIAVAILAAASPSTAGSLPGASSFGLSHSPVRRFESGAAAVVTISARIVRASGGVGAGRVPPVAGMVPRSALVSASDGRPVPALIYDFE